MGYRLGLAALVGRNYLGEDPADGPWFVFPNRGRTIVKLLSFDVGGHWVWARRLDARRFAHERGRDRQGALVRTALLALVEGADTGLEAALPPVTTGPPSLEERRRC